MSSEALPVCGSSWESRMTAELPPQIRELIDTRAQPITLSEITARAHTSPASSLGPPGAQVHSGLARGGLTRPKVRFGWVAALAAGVVAVGGAGAIGAAQLMAAGRPAAPPTVRPTGWTGTVLT